MRAFIDPRYSFPCIHVNNNTKKMKRSRPNKVTPEKKSKRNTETDNRSKLDILAEVAASPRIDLARPSATKRAYVDPLTEESSTSSSEHIVEDCLSKTEEVVIQKHAVVPDQISVGHDPIFDMVDETPNVREPSSLKITVTRKDTNPGNNVTASHHTEQTEQQTDMSQCTDGTGYTQDPNVSSSSTESQVDETLDMAMQLEISKLKYTSGLEVHNLKTQIELLNCDLEIKISDVDLQIAKLEVIKAGIKMENKVKIAKLTEQLKNLKRKTRQECLEIKNK